MISSGIVIVKDKTLAVAASIKALANQQVLVGVPSSTAGRTDVPITNAVIGYLMEHGSPSQNLPARPFLVPGVRNAMPDVRKRLRAAATTALSGRPDAVDKALHAVGLVAVNSVRKKITDGPFMPLAPSTIAQRQARGRTGDRPLIDTGQLRQSITYVIRKRGK
jgi:hypothetical protein